MIQQIRKHIEAFWRGRLTLEEQRRLVKQLECSDDELKARLWQEFQESSEGLPADQSEKMFSAIQQRLGHRKVVRFPVSVRYYVAAASILLALFSAVFYYGVSTTGPIEGTQQQVHIDTLIRKNQHSTILEHKLADGSVVRLYPNSTLRYLSDFGSSNRWLSLDGQAEFSVAKNAALPFSVHAKGYVTTALGTSFKVDARQNAVQVELYTGKVVVESDKQAVFPIKATYLVPGDCLIIDHDQAYAVLTKKEVLAANSTGKATTGKLVDLSPDAELSVDLAFKQEPLPRLFTRMEQEFNIQVAYRMDDVAPISFTGNFYSGESLQQVFLSICEMNGLDYALNGGRVRVYKR